MNIFASTLLGTSLLLLPGKPTPRPHEPVAVIELFTSQGCSSCPPADRLLTETIRTARQNGQRVYGLSFHVDYWDRLGWRDPFSQHLFTERQQHYSHQFAAERHSADNVYTPQAVLNGQQQFVGSSRAQLNRLLPGALQKPAPVEVFLEAPASTNRQLTLPYRLDGDLTDVVLNVALVSKTISTAVLRGENAGHTLTYDNVVWVLQTLPATKTGQINLRLPADFNPATGAVLAYAQLRRSGAILGADAVDLR